MVCFSAVGCMAGARVLGSVFADRAVGLVACASRLF